MFCCLGDEIKHTRNKIHRWYITGRERIDDEFNVVALFNGVRKLNVLFEASKISPREIIMAKENLIEIDSEDIFDQNELSGLRSNLKITNTGPMKTT